MTIDSAITINTISPVVTGGINGKCDKIHSTGIIGSLRWWYEAVIRGLGGTACDLVDDKCKKDNPCDACRFFGATGQRRAFRLIVEDKTESAEVAEDKKSVRATGVRYKRGSTTENSKWYFKESRQGQFSIKVIPYKRPGKDNPDPKIIIKGLLQLINNCGTIGAKPQLGYGRIKVNDNLLLVHADTFLEELKKSINKTNPPTVSHEGLTSIEKMFFANITPKPKKEYKSDQNEIEPVLDLKYDIRKSFRINSDATLQDDTLRHIICGTTSDEKRQASKIAISRNIKSTMRVCGWIQDFPNNKFREKVIVNIHTVIENFATINSWREFNSSVRDVKQNKTDINEFLKSLL